MVKGCMPSESSHANHSAAAGQPVSFCLNGHNGPLYHIRGFNVVSLGLTFVPQIVNTYLCYDTSNQSQNAAVCYHSTIFFLVAA